MLDRDGREAAAQYLRVGARTMERGDQECVERLAAALEAEREGYDYEAAAAERGEALAAIIEAHETAEAKYGVAGSGAARERLAEMVARGAIVMEGVEPSPRGEALEVLRELVAARDRGDLCLNELADMEDDAVVCDVFRSARLLLEGTERTHALVPLGALQRAGQLADEHSDDIAREVGEDHGPGGEDVDASLRDSAADAAAWARAFYAASRGERVVWPS